MLFVKVNSLVDQLNVDRFSVLGKGLFRRSSDFTNGTVMNSSSIVIYETEVHPECPSDTSTMLIADKNYCNVFYNCQSGRATVYMCREGTVFDSSNSTNVNSCRSEELVNCTNRLILTSKGRRLAKVSMQNSNMNSVDKKVSLGKSLQSKYSNFILLPPPAQNQKIVVNVQYDCKGRIDGHWRDTRYCDIFHACISGEQKRSYGCNQIGERFYFDDASQKYKKLT